MRGFYSLPSPRIWRAEALRRDTQGSQPDPYGADRPGYRQRTRQTVMQLAGGLTRVDIGDPSAPFDEPEGPFEVPEEPAAAAPDIRSVLRATSLPDFKPGLGRG